MIKESAYSKWDICNSKTALGTQLELQSHKWSSDLIRRILQPCKPQYKIGTLTTMGEILRICQLKKYDKFIVSDLIGILGIPYGFGWSFPNGLYRELQRGVQHGWWTVKNGKRLTFTLTKKAKRFVFKPILIRDSYYEYNGSITGVGTKVVEYLDEDTYYKKYHLRLDKGYTRFVMK